MIVEIKKSVSDMTQYIEVLTDQRVVKSTCFCVLLEEQTWTQNHVLHNFNLVHYSITVKRDLLNKKSTGELPLFPNMSVKF